MVLDTKFSEVKNEPKDVCSKCGFIFNYSFVESEKIYHCSNVALNARNPKSNCKLHPINESYFCEYKNHLKYRILKLENNIAYIKQDGQHKYTDQKKKNTLIAKFISEIEFTNKILAIFPSHACGETEKSFS